VIYGDVVDCLRMWWNRPELRDRLTISAVM